MRDLDGEIVGLGVTGKFELTGSGKGKGAMKGARERRTFVLMCSRKASLVGKVSEPSGMPARMLMLSEVSRKLDAKYFASASFQLLMMRVYALTSLSTASWSRQGECRI